MKKGRLTAAGYSNAKGALDIVRRTMGQSKIDVFRALLADETKAVAANAAFEAAYDRAVQRGEVRPVAASAAASRTMSSVPSPFSTAIAAVEATMPFEPIPASVKPR